MKLRDRLILIFSVVLLINVAIIYLTTQQPYSRFKPPSIFSKTPQVIVVNDPPDTENHGEDNSSRHSNSNIVTYKDDSSVNLGDSKEEVIRLLDEPKSKKMSNTGKESWKYSRGQIYFVDEVVVGWSNYGGKLNVKHNNHFDAQNKVKLKIGSTVAEVLNKCNTPTYIDISNNGPSHSIDFGNSSLRFYSNSLGGYDNTSGIFEFEFESPPTAECQGELKIDLGVKSDDIFACYGMPIGISKRGKVWVYKNFDVRHEGGEVVSYSMR